MDDVYAARIAKALETIANGMVARFDQGEALLSTMERVASALERAYPAEEHSDAHETGRLGLRWEGLQWKVDDRGLDTLDGKYLIEKSRLGELRPTGGAPMSDWLPHMAEKDWVNLADFEQAFRAALDEFEGEYQPLPSGALRRGLEEAQRIRQHR